MGLDDVIGNVATVGILAGMSLAMVKQLHPGKYEAERKRRAKVRVAKKKSKKPLAKKKWAKRSTRHK
jgi:hypothetical protein